MKYGDGQDSTHLSWASGAVTGATEAVTRGVEIRVREAREGQAGR